MTTTPKITAILAVPGFAPPGLSPPNEAETAGEEPRYLPPPRELVSIGLVLDGREVVWGDCLVTPGQLSDKERPFQARAALASIQKTIPRILRGAALDNFPFVAYRLDTFMETSPQAGQVGLIHPAIRYGLSQALLRVAAKARQTSLIQAMIDMYDLPQPAQLSPPPLQAEAGYPPAALPDSVLLSQARSISLTPPGQDAPAELGGSSEIVQRQIRQVRQALDALHPSQAEPGEDAHSQYIIHLNAAGGLGDLYKNDFGKIMGALFGLQAAAGAHTLQVEDPILKYASHLQIEVTAELKDYLRMRRMAVQLVAGSKIDSLKDIQMVIDQQGADLVRLRPYRLGSLHQTLKAISLCREHQIGVLLEVGTIESARSIHMLAQLALAAQPDLITAEAGAGTPPSLLALHNEMARLVAWPGE